MRRAVYLRGAAAIAALACAWVAYTQQGQRTAQKMDVSKLKDDLWVIRSTGSGNVALYVSNEGAIVVDDKFEVDYENLIAAMKSVTTQPIRYVFNTHQHGDHTGGNATFLALPAEIIVHRNARANMASAKMPGVPRVSFTDEAEVFLGGKEVRSRHFGRGHTNGDAVVYFPAQRVIHTGDLFVNGPYFIPNYKDGGSLREWPRTIDEVLKWDFDIVVPGHGPVATRADLVKFRGRLAEMWDRISVLSRGGKSREDISAMLKAEFSEFGNSIAAASAVDEVLAEMKSAAN
jgi:glyoxylase-like metal-dependent hydrolase (beta-lactamase superfamily II)